MLKKDCLSQWKITTSSKSGFHTVVSPQSGLTKSLWVYRLNLKKHESITISDDKLELAFAMIEGCVSIRISDDSYELRKLDSFYLPAKTQVTIKASEDTFMYVGGAVYEECGETLVHHFDADLPVGNVRQVHGEKPYRRDVYMTLGPDVSASRLICGFTWSDPGAWSSWPPHQHEKDLEEAYCYFDMNAPAFGLHLSYLESGKPTHAHIVHTGDVVLAPKGYHPTAAAPSNRNCYYWILAAHSHTSRRYDLALNDPAFTKK